EVGNVDDLALADVGRNYTRGRVREATDGGHLRLVVVVRQRPGHVAVEQMSAPSADDVETFGRGVEAVRKIVNRTTDTHRSESRVRGEVSRSHREVPRDGDAVADVDDVAIGRHRKRRRRF